MDETLKEIIRGLMDDPTANVEVFSGMRPTSNPEDEVETFEPTGGKTVVIHVGGGANNVEINRVKIEGEI